jgi:hypothetical protein
MDLLTRQVPLYVGHSSKLWSWHAASNCGRALTVRLLFPLSYTSGAGAAIRTPITDLRGRALPTELHQHNIFNNSGGGGENCTPDDLLCRQTPCCLGYTASNTGAEGGTRTRGLDVGNVASSPLDDFRMERTARVELASSGWRPEAPAAIPRPLLAGDEGLEPSYLELEASVLAAERISRKLLAELTGIEPVPADRQSAILPIDHSSGSLPWTRTTISAFRAQRPAIGRRGNFDCQRPGCRGAIRTPVSGFKIRSPATRRPGITLSAVSLSCTVRTTPPIHRRCGRVSCDPYERDLPTPDDLRRDRSRAPTQVRFQNRRVQSLVCS